MRTKYILMECNGNKHFQKPVFDSYFKEDVNIMKMRYEAQNTKNNRYVIEEIKTNM